MSKSKKGSSGLQNSKSTNFVQRLPGLARIAIAYDDSAQEKMHDLIYQQIREPSEKPISEALDNARTINEHQFMIELLEMAACDHTKMYDADDTKGIPFQTRLFVIPISGVIEEGGDLSGLSNDEAQVITKSLKKYGAFPDHTNVMVLGTFFRRTDLPSEFTRTNRLHEDFAGMVEFSMGIRKDDEDQARRDTISSFSMQSRESKKKEYSAEDNDSNDSIFSLRYLLGIAMGEDVPLPSESNNEYNEAFNVHGWRKEVEGILRTYYKENDVFLSLPGSYFQGLRSGMFYYYEYVVSLIFNEALTMQNLDANTASLTVAFSDESDSVTILLREDSTQKPIEACVLDLPDLYQETYNRVEEAVKIISLMLGIKKIYRQELAENEPLPPLSD